MRVTGLAFELTGLEIRHGMGTCLLVLVEFLEILPDFDLARVPGHVIEAASAPTGSGQQELELTSQISMMRC